MWHLFHVGDSLLYFEFIWVEGVIFRFVYNMDSDSNILERSDKPGAGGAWDPLLKYCKI